MKNAFYINCIADPWIKVAIELKEKDGINPVYWNGFAPNDDSDALVAKHFPGALYSEDYNAWRGIFPKEIQERSVNAYIDVDFLRKYASNELQAIKMMDRLDWDLYSLNFQERQRIFRNMIRSWIAAIEWLKPDVVISATMPHHVSDYALYLLCIERNIPYLFPERTAFPGRYIIPDNLYTIGSVLDSAFMEGLHKTDEVLLKELPDDVRGRFIKLKDDYAKGAPAFMAREVRTSKKYASLWGLANHFFAYFRNPGPHQPLFGKEGMLYHGVKVYYRKDKTWIEDAKFSLWKFCFMHQSAGRNKQKLYSYYKSLTSDVNPSDRYVFFGLHYQPENTSNPGGDIFVDQRLAIDLLLKYLPDDYKVYVKEHPHQYLKQRDGQTCRIKEFYDDLSKHPRIKLLDVNEGTFNLIQNSVAVATLKGTIGFEAMVYGKPVINFGVSWFEQFPGVLRITDENSASSMYSFIRNYQYDEHKLLAYLWALGQKSYYAYYYKGYMSEVVKQEAAEAIQTWVKTVEDFIA